jgi:hypothetical protein
MLNLRDYVNNKLGRFYENLIGPSATSDDYLQEPTTGNNHNAPERMVPKDLGNFILSLSD